MTHRAPRDTARRLIVSFVVALLAPATALVWLGPRFIEQDRVLVERQFRERRESAADRAIAGLEQALAACCSRQSGVLENFLPAPSTRRCSERRRTIYEGLHTKVFVDKTATPAG